MCSIIEDIEEDNELNSLENISTNCKKCDLKGTILLRKKDFYCENCFVKNTNHKFRASLGKTKTLKQKQNILIALSGGLSSMTLLQLVYHGITLDTHKKLRMLPYCVHIIGCLNPCVNRDIQKETAKKIIDLCEKYNIKIYIIDLSLHMQKDFQLPYCNKIPNIDDKTEEEVQRLANHMTSTGKNDLLANIKRKLYIKVAEKLDCNIIFTAETTTNLATKTLSNLALGRGSQIEHDVGFSDSRHKNIQILRPMKDISDEELNYYAKINNITPACQDAININEVSLHSVIRTFFTDLQENYQSTISTVCKTAEKLGIQDKGMNDQRCPICESTLDTHCDKSSALQATNFSRMVSSVHPQHFNTIANSVTQGDVSCTQDNGLMEKLCYGCRLTSTELNDIDIQEYFL